MKNIFKSLFFKVNDIENVLKFYKILGFSYEVEEKGIYKLFLEGKNFFIYFIGLYHFALLVPSRKNLAGILRKLINNNFKFEGFADHGVSEAIYIIDPQNITIEIYCDKYIEKLPKEMITDYLDIENLLKENNEEEFLHPQTIIGHLHFYYNDLKIGKLFYENLGINIWAKNRFPPANSTGFIGFEMEIPFKFYKEEKLIDPLGNFLILKPK
ncbi:MAG: hypothetical protein ABIL76_06140 [candidate division WOR-3 bacterium]